jgi:hypothetical protein
VTFLHLRQPPKSGFDCTDIDKCEGGFFLQRCSLILLLDRGFQVVFDLKPLAFPVNFGGQRLRIAMVAALVKPLQDLSNGLPGAINSRTVSRLTQGRDVA